MRSVFVVAPRQSRWVPRGDRSASGHWVQGAESGLSAPQNANGLRRTRLTGLRTFFFVWLSRRNLKKEVEDKVVSLVRRSGPDETPPGSSTHHQPFKAAVEVTDARQTLWLVAASRCGGPKQAVPRP
jgi:hypothetical protein